jgi:hypothetical protein
MDEFRVGDRIEPSAEGLKTFRNWAQRTGTIVGKTRETGVWQIRWDNANKPDLIHRDFITLSDAKKRTPIPSLVTDGMLPR